MTNNLANIFFRWFFAVAPWEILRLGRNFLLWGWKFFSIGYFLPRLFSPWHRDLSSYGRGFDLERFLQVWGWNFVSRFLGAAMRLVVMGFGLFVELMIIFATAITFIVWFVLPAGGAILIILGLITLFVSR